MVGAVETFNTEEVLTALLNQRRRISVGFGEGHRYSSGKQRLVTSMGNFEIMQMGEWAVKEEDANTEELIKVFWERNSVICSWI